MLILKDLIGIPWKDNGRALDGFDCYGLAIEIEKRLGKNLKDVIYNNHSEELENINVPTLNVEKTEKIEIGNIISMTIKSELHIGVIISDKEFIHATRNQGVRISLISNYKIKNIYKVI